MSLFRGAVALVLALVALQLAAVEVHASGQGYTYKLAQRGCLTDQDHSKWMAGLPDNAKVFLDLSIPGTHDSATYVYKGSDMQQCQCSHILEQLKAGIRFLDLRFAFHYGSLILMHGTVVSAPFFAKFDDVMDDIQLFLKENPSEVVIARIDVEGTVNWPQYDWKDATAQEKFAKYVDMQDRACLSARCELGPSRGKVIYLNNDKKLDFLLSLDYRRVFSSADWCGSEQIQDNFSKKPHQAYEKWTDIRGSLIAASTENPLYGRLNYASATGKALSTFPYFFASGSSSPKGPRLTTGIVTTCLNGGSKKYIDFPRGACTCGGRASLCSIYYQGMNNMLYEWIDNGLNGRPQSREVSYVFPRHLGIIPMDFPSNALVKMIIDVNFATQPPAPAEDKIPYTCGIKCSCIAGDALIMTESRGNVSARDVTMGDRIAGPSDGEWCDVMETAAMSNGTAYGEFTEDHLVVGVNATVGASGAEGAAREVDLVNIATTCPVARTASGNLFTPLSTVFCDRTLSWSEYVLLYQAILRIARKTGTFWFNPSTYLQTNATLDEDDSSLDSQSARESFTSSASSSSDDDDSQDDVPIVATFVQELPSICDALLRCAKDSTSCEAFETMTAQWLSSYLPAEKYDVVVAAYPGLGSDNTTAGTLMRDVHLGSFPESSSSSTSSDVTTTGPSSSSSTSSEMATTGPSSSSSTSSEMATTGPPPFSDSSDASVPTSQQPTAAPDAPKHSRMSKSSLVVAIVVPVVAVLAVGGVVALVVYCCCVRKRRAAEPSTKQLSVSSREPVSDAHTYTSLEM